MAKVAILSMHTSPLAQPGTGDGGGMNVYVREVATALARSGVSCDVFTRAFAPGLPEVVRVEPGFTVRHVVAGPASPLDKGALFQLVEEFADAVAVALGEDVATGGAPAQVLHANYWLSGIAGHLLKHRLDLPLVSTFHTLDRVKAALSPEDVDPNDPGRRARAEAGVIGCSDAVLASCSVEADQLIDLYGADPARVAIVPPGVDSAYFSPGSRPLARRAVSLATGGPGSKAGGKGPLLLFVGRIQPLKGADLALGTLAALEPLGVEDARLLIVGGPSGPAGAALEEELRAVVDEAGLAAQVAFLAPQPHELLSTYYRAADVCVVPSRSESFGLVALEAAACGTPVVASAVGGLTTLVEHGATGFLVEEPSAAAFAERVAAIWRDRALADSLGAQAAATARRYSWATAAASLSALYERCAESQLVECG